uniref:Uncharacterized protein n=1 Tax=Octopus bimaculoides TaxID=37653 RepID=A0A0L8HQJ3_OCTBM
MQTRCPHKQVQIEVEEAVVMEEVVEDGQKEEEETDRKRMRVESPPKSPKKRKAVKEKKKKSSRGKRKYAKPNPRTRANKHVHSIEYHDVSESCSHCIVRCLVIPSIPTSNQKKNPDHKVWVIMSNVTGNVHSADCNC